MVASLALADVPDPWEPDAFRITVRALLNASARVLAWALNAPALARRFAMVGEFGGIGAFVQGKEWVAGKCTTYLHVDTPGDEAATYVGFAQIIASQQGSMSASVYTQVRVRPRGLGCVHVGWGLGSDSGGSCAQITDVELECDGFLNYDRTAKFTSAQRRHEPAVDCVRAASVGQHNGLLFIHILPSLASRAKPLLSTIVRLACRLLRRISKFGCSKIHATYTREPCPGSSSRCRWASVVTRSDGGSGTLRCGNMRRCVGGCLAFLWPNHDSHARRSRTSVATRRLLRWCGPPERESWHVRRVHEHVLP